MQIPVRIQNSSFSKSFNQCRPTSTLKSGTELPSNMEPKTFFQPTSHEPHFYSIATSDCCYSILSSCPFINAVKMPSNTLPPNPNPSHIYYPPHRHKPGRFQRRFPRTSIGIMTVVITWPIWLIGIGMISAVRSRVRRRRETERVGERDRDDDRPRLRART